MFDPEKFGQAMGEAIRKAVEPLHSEIAALKKTLAAVPDLNAEIVSQVAKAVAALPPAAAGKSITIEEVRPVLDDALNAIRADADAAIKAPLLLAESARDMLLKAVGELRQPADGKSVTVEDVRPVLEEAVREVRKESAAAVERILMDGRADREALQKAISELRQPEDGQSVTVDELAPLVREEVQKAVSALPVSKDGVGLAGAMIDREGALLVTLTNGTVKSLGPVVGKDGISLEAFEMDYLEEAHEVRVKASCAGRTKELRYPAGGLRPAGYWREGTRAKACETWVHDGSLWIATKDTASKPETKADGWIIAARKGRDGETIVKTVNAGPPPPIKIGS